MSREQWGHGYWQGVKDAETNNVRTKFANEVKAIVCHMCISNIKKDHDKSLYPVRELIARLRLDEVSDEYAKKVYDYITEHEPYGCYVSGDPRWEWKDDYFVLPNGYNDVACWEKELERMENKCMN